MEVQQLISPLLQGMSGTQPVAFYKALWIKAFPLAATKGKKYWAQRLKELQTWDTCNGKENERQGKIQALEILSK